MTQHSFLQVSIALTCLTIALMSSCKRSAEGDEKHVPESGSTGTASRPAGSQSSSAVAPSAATSPGTAPPGAVQTGTSQTAGALTVTGTNAPPASSARVNLIAMSAGTITREWPPTAMGPHDWGPNALTFRYAWHSKSGTLGPYVFVFEFAGSAEIDSLGFLPWSGWDEKDLPYVAQAVRVEGSMQGPDSGYSKLGEYSLQATGKEQDFPLPAPATARWLRLTVQQRQGAEYTALSRVFAYGKLQLSPAKPISGIWLYDNRPNQEQDPLFQGPGKLPAVADPALVDETYRMLQIVQQGSEFRTGSCHPTSNVIEEMAGSQSGTHLTWESLPSASPLADGVLNAEGNMIVGANSDDDSAYLLLRLPPVRDCSHVAKPAGTGQTVLVLTDYGVFHPYPPPPDNLAQFPGYRFVPLSMAVFTPEALTGVDAVILGYVCDLGKKIAPWQAQALLDFTQAGHKLIIDDADNCTSTDYSFLPYQFHTSNPGAQGKKGNYLILVEPNTLGSDAKDSKQYLDLESWVSATNDIGDSNTVTTMDPHWCGHLFGTNALNVNGFMHMYAPLGQGLIIFDGFDKDDSSHATYLKVLLLELQQPVPALLPCTQSVAGKFLIAPSKRVPFVPGKSAQVQVSLQVLANQGYAGTVSLAAKAPADAPWKTALSVGQVTLKGDVAPVNFTLDVPANAAPGGHEFLVNGDDGKGNTASATITLVTAVVPQVEKVESVANGCTQQLTIGSDALFAFAEATLTPTAQKTLSALGPAIKKVGQHPVQIHGYTDSIGSDNYNQLLSEQRARAVRDWLAAHHFLAASTPIQGFGKKNPVAPNSNENGSDNPAGRAKNRRVEVLIDTCK